MLQRRARRAGITTAICNHSWRATGITVFLENGGAIEMAQYMAGHADPRTTKLYDRRRQKVTRGEVERIRYERAFVDERQKLIDQLVLSSRHIGELETKPPSFNNLLKSSGCCRPVLVWKRVSVFHKPGRPLPEDYRILTIGLCTKVLAGFAWFGTKVLALSAPKCSWISGLFPEAWEKRSGAPDNRRASLDRRGGGAKGHALPV